MSTAFQCVCVFNIISRYAVLSRCIELPESFPPAQPIGIFMINRHGPRAPTAAVAEIPFQESDFPRGLKQLTEKGEKMMDIFGDRLRQRYNFLFKDVGCSVLKVTSSNVSRTIQTAQHILKGMRCENVPVLINTCDKGAIAHSPTACPAYNKEREEYWKNYTSPVVTKMENELTKLLTSERTLINMEDPITDLENELNKLTKAEKKIDMEEAFNIIDAIICLRAAHLSLPNWVPDKLFEMIPEYIDAYWSMYTATETQKRLLFGPLIENAIQTIDAISQNEGKDNTKMNYHSAHDLTIHGFLSSIGITNQIAPEFGSSLILEVYRVCEKNYIKVIYNKDYTLQNVTTLNLPNCAEYCSFENFKQLAQKVIPTHWDIECKIMNSK